jgi:2-polyprenyl-3-methyl-5-hydroxy-6-metoxy-1,4-benzoquinol methylase
VHDEGVLVRQHGGVSEPVEPPDNCLTVIVPCYNEAERVTDALTAVLASPYVAEVVVVDDGSTDATAKLVEAVVQSDDRVRLVRQPCNLGKGAALRRGFREATAPYVIVQDADLEYDPADWGTLLQPLVDGRADVVYGSRFHTANAHRVLYYWHSVGNRFLTTLSNMATNLNLTDMETCSKAFRREVIQSIVVHEDRFGFEPEVTAKVAAAGWRVYEVGVTYDGRTYAEGKKIGWRDGVRAVWCIGRYSRHGERLSRRFNPEPKPSEFADADLELAEVLDVLEGADQYADWVASLLVDHLGDRILEVGGGIGSMTRRLAEHGAVTAVEPSDRAITVLRELAAGDDRIDVVHGTVEDLPPGPGYDTAVLVNVLEHVPDDAALLRQIRDHLDPHGRVVCFVPAHTWLHSRFDDRIGHIRRYRRSALAEAFGEAGYAVEELRHVNAPGALAWLVGARMLDLSPSERTTAVYQRAVLPVVGKLESGWQPPFGQSLVVVARPVT